ncbi:MAG TPA: 2'-5' RNA ligase family protein [Thermoanaerobaculia bacterium]|nr:2'-5' RNA ligase family protein [Thermoanaerobaculia bacterium]
MRKLRYAYYLLADPSEPRLLRDETCWLFPEHITIRGRFLASPSKVADLVIAGREVFRTLAPFTAELHGPRVFASGLSWYELREESAALPAIRSIHRHLDRELRDRGLLLDDEVPASHSGELYKPHMTLSFRRLAPEQLQSYPATVRVPFVEWGLFRYDGWPSRPKLRCVFGEHLYGRTTARPFTSAKPAWI